MGILAKNGLIKSIVKFIGWSKIHLNRGSLFNPSSTNVSLLYPLKISENLRFSDVFRGYRSETSAENELKKMAIQI